jgi:uncharacterized protein (DUF1499 family)
MKSRYRTVILSLLAIVLLLPALLIGVAQLGALSGSPPADLGVKAGRLKPPSPTPNSVSSQAALYPDHPQAARAAIEPLRYQGDGRAAMRSLAAILGAMERTVLVTDEPGYLYAQSTTKLMRFTDDIEFHLDEAAGVIHVRSASRIGHGDRGVNRARVEAIRAAFHAASGVAPETQQKAVPLQ